ncbi:MAG: NAD(P)H-binding protein [Paludibacter sp.]|nr:MAG: NAD(P)H-binding protein [Paludibacter sp.]
MKKVALAGATGLIGGQLLLQLTADESVEEIRVLVRRPLPTNDARIKVILLAFTDRQAIAGALAGCDTVFCAVGTTRKKTPDLAEYRKIDFDIPVTLAQLSAEAGVRSFHLVSSVGASVKSNNFYLKIKGETEEAVSKAKLARIVLYRPSLLLGKRNEIRIAEIISSWIVPLLTFLFPPDYKPIRAELVARAMIRDAKQQAQGVTVAHYSQMVR